MSVSFDINWDWCCNPVVVASVRLDIWWIFQRQDALIIADDVVMGSK
jgi:hypothetical protein